MIKKHKINRQDVHNKCNGHCGYCGKEITIKEMQIDHMEPLFRNHTDKQLEYYKRERGTDHMDNLLPSCARCNRWKSTFTVEDFRNIVQTSIDRLERDTPNFRLARDFGLIEISKKEVIFYFENMNEEKTKWENYQFPIIKNVNPRLLSDEIEGIATEDMPRRMAEMFESVFDNAVKTINEELEKIRGIEGKEERVKYLEELLSSWSKK